MYPVFDFDGFWDDVTRWLDRWKLNIIDIVEMTGMDRGTVTIAYRYRRSMNLNSVCKIAAVVDLSLDKYNKAENYVTT